jgi:hypothetical protein
MTRHVTWWNILANFALLGPLAGHVSLIVPTALGPQKAASHKNRKATPMTATTATTITARGHKKWAVKINFEWPTSGQPATKKAHDPEWKCCRRMALSAFHGRWGAIVASCKRRFCAQIKEKRLKKFICRRHTRAQQLLFTLQQQHPFKLKF